MKHIADRSPFFAQLRERINSLGGMFNAHVHLDRAGTLDDRYFKGTLQILENSHISLQQKHHLIASIHAGPAYHRDDLERRANATLDIMVASNTARVDTMVDVTDDEVGLTALEMLAGIRDARHGEIELKLAAYTPLGFKDSEPGRWRLYEQAAQRADFLGCLPEADDRDDYPDHIGFEEQLVRVLDLGRRLKRLVHVHVDQRNESGERGTERLLEVIRKEGGVASADGAPMIWAVHMISPTTYDEPRHARLVEGLLECNVGVISCPSAALGMRQLRPLNSPTSNSIPRILELAASGVHVRLGSDNIADICSPSTTADLMDELFVLSAAVRYYQIDILARLAAGQKLSEDERGLIKEHLHKNDLEIDKVLHAAAARSN
ncbi:amidohydrolase family protein [Devosia sp. CAU 1758]